jgi:hypothetical protein
MTWINPSDQRPIGQAVPMAEATSRPRSIGKASEHLAHRWLLPDCDRSREAQRHHTSQVGRYGFVAGERGVDAAFTRLARLLAD